MVKALTEDAEVGKIYTGKVVRTTDFGAFVEILPASMVWSISASWPTIEYQCDEVVKVGDEIMVMVTDIDRDGKIRSRVRQCSKAGLSNKLAKRFPPCQQSPTARP